MDQLRRSRSVAILMLGIAALVLIAIVENLPGEQPDAVLTADAQPDAVARVRLTVDTVDAARSVMKIRLSAAPGPQPLPAGGVTVLTNIDNVAPLRLEAGSPPQELTAEVPFERGYISAYPFDRYDVLLSISVVEGGGPSARANARAVPFDATAVDSSVGFSVEGEDRPDGSAALRVNVSVSRTVPIVVWVCIMIAIYWLLALSVMTVTILVLMRLREWESRHLAWLGTMLFAFATFRTAAPGTPPVGTFLDYAGFFWAELVVSISLMGLVVFYLVGLKDPEPSEPDPSEPDPSEPDPSEPDPSEPDPNEPDPNEPDPNDAAAAASA